MISNKVKIKVCICGCKENAHPGISYTACVICGCNKCPKFHVASGKH